LHIKTELAGRNGSGWAGSFIPSQVLWSL